VERLTTLLSASKEVTASVCGRSRYHDLALLLL
jgi:hypothetical protein